MVVLPGLNDEGEPDLSLFSGTPMRFSRKWSLRARLQAKNGHEWCLELIRGVEASFWRRSVLAIGFAAYRGTLRTVSLPDTAWADYERDGKTEVLVNRHVGFFRSIFVPSLAMALEDTQDGRCSHTSSNKARTTTGRAPQAISLVHPDDCAGKGNEYPLADCSTQKRPMSVESPQTACAPLLRSEGANSAHRHIFYGWWVVLTSAVGLFLGPFRLGVCFPCVSQADYAGFPCWSGGGFTGFHSAPCRGAISAPFVGWLIDRYGSRRVILWALSYLVRFCSEQSFLGQYRAILFLLYRAWSRGKWCRTNTVRYVVSHWFD